MKKRTLRGGGHSQSKATQVLSKDRNARDMIGGKQGARKANLRGGLKGFGLRQCLGGWHQLVGG